MTPTFEADLAAWLDEQFVKPETASLDYQWDRDLVTIHKTAMSVSARWALQSSVVERMAEAIAYVLRQYDKDAPEGPDEADIVACRDALAAYRAAIGGEK